jgi:hypothetical protein
MGKQLVTGKRTWLLMVYTVPREPSASRVYAWRKLNRLGALMLQDAVWVLPFSPKTREHFQWLAAEIGELGGSATLWQSEPLLDGQEKEMVQRFEMALRKSYQEILAALKRKNPNLASLSRRYQQLQLQDYFHCELGRRIHKSLISARGASP